jgi:FixJ family two-component response regulator
MRPFPFIATKGLGFFSMEAQLQPARVVHIVDDDAQLRSGIARLLRSHGCVPHIYESASEFLNTVAAGHPACVVLDLQMPDLSGLEVQEQLARRKNSLSIVFISGHGNIPASVQAMKAGAVDFLTKPFEDDQLISAIDAAMERSWLSQQQDQSVARDSEIFERLSPRERQVCLCVVEGMLNKQIAADFGTKERTIKKQRGSLMQKLQVNSAADVVRLVERLRSVGYFAKS